MDLFLVLFFKILALSVTILIGFIARKFLKAETASIASIVFYLISPIVFFDSIARVPFEKSLFILPLIIALLSSIMCVATFYICKRFFPSQPSGILSFTAGSGNVGYFLLPVAWILFDEKLVGIYVIMIIGNAIYDSSVGFFAAARGHYSVKEAAIKLVKLPTFYALIIGFVFSSISWLEVPEIFDDVAINIRGAYSVLGMMMIGMGLADVKSYKIDFTFMSLMFIPKFIIWPLMMILFIKLDNQVFHLYDNDIYKMMWLFSLAPLAANSIVIATVFKSEPEKVASMILISTIFAVFYIPLMVPFFIN